MFQQTLRKLGLTLIVTLGSLSSVLFLSSAARAALPDPTISAVSFGPENDVRIFVTWKIDEDFQEELGARIYRDDQPIMDILPQEYGYTEGTAGGWFEDGEVIANQVYTYGVQIFDRMGETSSIVKLSIKATPDPFTTVPPDGDDDGDQDGADESGNNGGGGSGSGSGDDPTGKKRKDCTTTPVLTTEVKGRDVTLRWTKMCDAEEYEVWRESVAEQGKEKGPFEVGDRVLLATGIKELTYVDRDLEPGDYFYEVIGYRIISDTPGIELPPAALKLLFDRALAANALAAGEEVGRASARVTIPGPGSGASKSACRPLASTGLPTSSILPDRPEGSWWSIECAVEKIYEITIVAGAVIFVILLLIGGIMYLTAGGDEERNGKAKRLIIDAIVGLILVLAAWAVGQFILDRLWGA